MGNAIEIMGVRKTFGPKVAVDDLNLTVPSGSISGFLGPNGAGKTTTIRMIMSIIFADRGDIRVLGKGSAMEHKDRIGYLPEERGLYRKMRVGAFLNYMGKLKGLSGAEADKRTRAWLEKVGLGAEYRKRCEELSKGMQQKVQFIASVIHEPELIILDEVFSGLDPVNRRLMRELIDEQHRQGRTIVFSTHAMFEAEALCEHVFMINRGKKVLDGSLRQIVSKHDPRSLVVEAADGEDVGGALQRLPIVAAVRRAEEKGLGSERLIVELKDGLAPVDAIPTIAGAARLRRIEVLRATLEDIFIGVVNAEADRAGDSAARVDRGALRGAGAASLEGGE